MRKGSNSAAAKPEVTEALAIVPTSPLIRGLLTSSPVVSQMMENKEALLLDPEIVEAAIARLEETASALLLEANKIEIGSQGEFELADETKELWKKEAKEFDEFRLSLTRSLDEAKKQRIAIFRALIETRGTAVEIVEAKMLAYAAAERRREEEERQRAEERIREETARRQREEQRIRDAEERLRAEAEETRRKAAEAEDLQERQRLEAQARSLDNKAERKNSLAESKSETTRAVVSSISVPSRTPVTAASDTRKRWKGEFVDLMKVVKGIAEGKLPITLVSGNQSVLDDLAKTWHTMPTPDGLRFYEKEGYASKRSK